MGRATEFFDYISRDYEPDAEYCRENYCGINERDYFDLRRKLAKERKKIREARSNTSWLFDR